MVDTVRVWDEWGQEAGDAVEPWDTWEKVKAVRGFPGGLIAFLQTSTDSEGCGFQYPTLVQAYSWPILQQGKDLVGVAKTGSGKTLAFLLPGFIKLRRLKKVGEVDTNTGPALLALTPTRELCYQIYSDTVKFGKPVQISAACAYGGAPKRDQEWELKNSPDCLIATPGRLNDFCNSRSVDLSQVRFAILDEADRMLDMGFEPQIREIMDRVPDEHRQTAMFTATWPRECRDLAARYIKKFVQVQIGSDDITTNRNITQHVEVCSSDSEKREALKKILWNLSHKGCCLVFCNTKKKCRDLAWDLNKENDKDRGGLPAEELHGDLDQRARDSALAKFKAGDARVLVATDVAARGLDIRNITVVVNYDVPNTAEDYVHRIGRTGRADDKGEAFSLIGSWGEEKKARNIVSVMEKAGQEPPQALQDVANGGSSGGSSWGKKEDWGAKKDDWGAKKDDWGAKKDDWGAKKDDWSDWKKDDWSSKKDDWKKDDWSSKKDDWKKDDWSSKKDDWSSKKDDWSSKKDDWSSKKDDWSSKKDDWKKDDWKKDDWSAKKDDWKKDDWKKDDWKKDDWKKDDWKKDDWKKDGADDAAMPEEPGKEAGNQEEAAAADEPKEDGAMEEGAAQEGAVQEDSYGADGYGAAAEDTPQPAAEDAPPAEDADMAAPDAMDESATGGVKRTAEEAGLAEEEPPAKVGRAEEEEEAAVGADGANVKESVLAGDGNTLKVTELKAWLEDHGLPITGVKSQLIDRVTEALESGAG